MQRPYFGIGEAARETGLTYRTIRFYEQKGLIKPNKDGTQRLYWPEHIARLKEIDRLAGYGFTLAEIKKGVTKHDLERQRFELTMLIEDKKAALECLCTAIERCDG